MKCMDFDLGEFIHISFHLIYYSFIRSYTRAESNCTMRGTPTDRAKQESELKKIIKKI